MTRNIPYPDDDYLTEIGRMVYALAYLEWLALGDLGHLPGLPPELTVEKLAGQPTGEIAKALRANVAEIADPATQAYLQGLAEALGVLAPRRNGVAHARPATIDDEQRLNRWAKRSGRLEAYPITGELLADLIDDIEAAVTETGKLRPAPPRPEDLG